MRYTLQILFTVFILTSCSERTPTEKTTFKIINGDKTKTIEVNLDDEQKIKKLITDHYSEILNSKGCFEIETQMLDKVSSKSLSEKTGSKVTTTKLTTQSIWIKVNKENKQFEYHGSDKSNEWIGTAKKIEDLADIIVKEHKLNLKMMNGEEG